MCDYVEYKLTGRNIGDRTDRGVEFVTCDALDFDDFFVCKYIINTDICDILHNRFLLFIHWQDA